MIIEKSMEGNPNQSNQTDESIREKISVRLEKLKAEKFVFQNRIEDIRQYEAEASLIRRMSKEDQYRVAQYKAIREQIFNHHDDPDWSDVSLHGGQP